MKRGDFITEGAGSWGMVLTCGPVSYDVIWIGGSTQRFRHSDGRHIRVVEASELDVHSRRHLLGEYKDAIAERRRGARIRRGTVSPSR